jgi:hypothetical protein
MNREIGNSSDGRKLFDVAREKMRTRHMAYRTEQAYLQWIRRYIAFHDRRHPRDLGGPEVEQFLTYLAVVRKVSANKAFKRHAQRSVVARRAGSDPQQCRPNAAAAGCAAGNGNVRAGFSRCTR